MFRKIVKFASHLVFKLQSLIKEPELEMKRERSENLRLYP